MATWFGVITKQAIGRGTFKSVAHLIRRINDYIANWNSDCKPFTWTADAASILAKVKFVESQVRAITGHYLADSDPGDRVIGVASCIKI